MHKRLSVLTVAAMLAVLAACGEDDQGGSTTAAEHPPATETTAKPSTNTDERAAAEKARAKLKAKAKAIAKAKERRTDSGASGAPAADRADSNAPVQPPPSDEEVLERLGYTNRALTPPELVEHCKGTAASARKLSDSERQRLVGICNESASGSRAEIKAAAVEVCQAAVESELPKDGPLYEVALEACEKTGDAPSAG